MQQLNTERFSKYLIWKFWTLSDCFGRPKPQPWTQMLGRSSDIKAWSIQEPLWCPVKQILPKNPSTEILQCNQSQSFSCHSLFNGNLSFLTTFTLFSHSGICGISTLKTSHLEHEFEISSAETTSRSASDCAEECILFLTINSYVKCNFFLFLSCNKIWFSSICWLNFLHIKTAFPHSCSQILWECFMIDTCGKSFFLKKMCAL